MKNDFVPTRYSNIITLERNFIEKIKIYAKTLGIDPEQVAETIDTLNRHIDSYAEMISKKAEAKAATENHKMLQREGVAEFRRISKVIKFSKNYSQAIGDDLGIVGPEIYKRAAHEMKPALSAIPVAEAVRIKFRKNRAEGIRIYSRQGDETKFTFLAACTFSPYFDKRLKQEKSKPEQREYYAYFTYNGQEIGNKSDVVRVTIA